MQKEREALRAEFAVLKLVKHPNIIHLKNQFETRKNTYIVMGLCSGGDLFDRLIARRQFSESVVCSIIKKLLSVILYLHGAEHGLSLSVVFLLLAWYFTFWCSHSNRNFSCS